MFTTRFNKKKHFNGMLDSANRVIAELEFKKFTALIERENVRRQYDQFQDTLARINAQLLATPDEDKLKEELAAIEKSIKDAKDYLDAIDGTVAGSAPTERLPDGAKGIDNELKEYVTRKGYIMGFIKLNC